MNVMSSANIAYNLNFKVAAANSSSSTSKFALNNRNSSLLQMSVYSGKNESELHAEDQQQKPAFLPRLPEKFKQCWNETTHLINDYYLTNDTKCEFSKVARKFNFN